MQSEHDDERFLQHAQSACNNEQTKDNTYANYHKQVTQHTGVQEEIENKKETEAVSAQNDDEEDGVTGNDDADEDKALEV